MQIDLTYVDYMMTLCFAINIYSCFSLKGVLQVGVCKDEL